MLTPALVSKWQRHIGYVPQSIYLTDGTIAENIALSTDRGSIDLQPVYFGERDRVRHPSLAWYNEVAAEAIKPIASAHQRVRRRLKACGITARAQ